MIKEKIVVTCDICSSNKTFDNIHDTKVEFLHFSLESLYLDRHFIDKHICKSCYLKIKQTTEKQSW